MAILVLNRRDEATLELHTMPRYMVESIIQKIAPMKLQQIFLHADWSSPPEYCQWLFAELKKLGIQTTICTSSIQSLASIKTFFDEGMFIELCLERTQPADPGEDLGKISGLRFFIPVDTISRDGSLYSAVLHRIPKSTKVTLGINWKSRLSGPLPIDEDAYADWSETAITLIDTLSSNRITAEAGCGLKLCMFTREQLGHLPTRLLEWPLAYCARSYFYDTDGSLRPCMRLAVPEKLSFNYESDINEVSEAFANWLAPFSGHCMESDDLNCRSLKIGCCNTGCIEHAADEWRRS